MISTLVESKIVNFGRIQREISPMFIKTNNMSVTLNSRMHNKKVVYNIRDFENFVKEVLKISNTLPGKRCAIVYTTDCNSNICVDLYPVVGAA
jgi:hypothetical protein